MFSLPTSTVAFPVCTLVRARVVAWTRVTTTVLSATWATMVALAVVGSSGLSPAISKSLHPSFLIKNDVRRGLSPSLCRTSIAKCRHGENQQKKNTMNDNKKANIKTNKNEKNNISTSDKRGEKDL